MINTTKTTDNWALILSKKDARIAELEALVKYYEGQLLLAKHRQYGSSSEKMNPGQLNLFDEAENTADPERSEPDLEEIVYKRRKQKGKREDDLSALPTETIEYVLPEEDRNCVECGGKLHTMSHDVRRELEIVPASVKVIEYKRAVYSCRACEKNNDHVPIVKAPMPESVIKGSLASPSTVAHIMYQKYVMCSPLYRQEKDWERQGVYLNRQTMANWVNRCSADWLEPLYDRMQLKLLTSEVLHADETVVQVLKEPDKKPQASSYMWLYRTSGDARHPIVLYDYQVSREHIHPKLFLKDFKGYLHADGYAGYHALPVTIIACWVHMRRKFEESLKAMPEADRPGSLAQQALNRIARLFHLETLWAGLPPEERYEKRKSVSMPLAEAFFVWIEGLDVLPKMPIGQARKYALDQRPRLMNVYLDGRCELSNNRAENSIRPFVVGRKNWLFCDTQKGAKASAVVYSMIETAKENGLKPYDYLKFLFETVPQATTGALDSLLPWGDAVPMHCRMPVKAKEGQHGEKKRA